MDNTTIFPGQCMINSTRKINLVSCAGATYGLHHLEIQNYSHTKGRGIGTEILSATFFVGGHKWRIICFLDGNEEQYSDYISVFLQYCSKSNTEASAKFGFSLQEHATGAAKYKTETLNSSQFSSARRCQGWPEFIKRDTLEASSCLKDDTLTIICDVTVISEPHTHDATVPLTVIPFNLPNQHGTLMSAEKAADIILEVDGKCFSAHSTVVASSSPVFRAQLSGMMKEGGNIEQKIKITGMEAPPFEVLLRYIYTDDLPDIEILTAPGMAQQLFMAADQFGMNKLRTSCENKLSDGLHASNVYTALVLADQYCLSNLKRACAKYLSSPEAPSCGVIFPVYYIRPGHY